MPYRYAEFHAGEYYHIYHRGQDRQKIFFESENYLHFLRLLKKYRDAFEMNLIAYCLMPNHFHLLVQPKIFDNLSRFVGRLEQSYAQALNKRYHRRGNLFHNERFRHAHVYSDRYQLLACRYIHFNPKKDGLVASLRDWPFSNYLEFVGAREGELWMPAFRERFFKTAKEYEDFVAGYGTEEDRDLEKYLFGSK